MRKAFRGAFLIMIGISFLVLSGCAGTAEKASKITSIGEDELDPAVWGESYPLQYTSYLKNDEMAKTDFGGSVDESKYIMEPEILELFKGNGFSIEYKEDRGHTYALQDLLSSKRVNATTPGSCLTCKTPSAPVLMEELGADYYTTPLLEMAKNAKHGVACADCHDSKTMDLRITRPGFVKAMKERGIDVNKASRQEMRSYVCGQCHVEYYFERESKEVVFPWVHGIEPGQINDYYNKIGFFDWEHPDSKAKMRKAQHPEFEMWSTGVHGSAGVSCSDCHMPYIREDGKKYSSHWWTSPLKTIDVSCQTCHKQDEAWLKDRVLYTQTKTFEMQTRAAEVITEAHQAIKKAIEIPNTDNSKVTEAQELVAKAQWHWDWVAAENSRGFHNPIQVMDSLGLAIDYGHKAKEEAHKAY